MKKQLSDEVMSHIKMAVEEVKPTSSCNKFIVVLNNGDAIHSGGVSCTAWLTNDYTKGIDGGVVAILSLNQIGRGLTNEEKQPFLDWLINRSPYNSTFISDDASVVLADGYVVSNPDSPSNLMLGGLIAHRCMWELTGTVKAFNLFVGMGISEDLAFLLASETIIRCSGEVTFRERHDPHAAVSSGYDEQAIKAFLTHTPTKLLKPWNNGRDSRSIFYTWGDYTGFNYLSDKLSNLTVKNAVDAKRVNNPFVKAYDRSVEGGSSNIYSVADIREYLPPLCHSIMEELT